MTSAAPTPSHGTAPTGPAQAAQAAGGRPGARKPGAQDAPDIFTQLMSLLSASPDTPPAIGASDTADLVAGTDPLSPGDDPAATGEAALAAMLQWAGLPQAGGATARSASGAGAPAGDALSTPMPAGAPALPAPSVAADALPPCMRVLDRPEAVDARTLSALADGNATQVPEASAATAGADPALSPASGPPLGATAARPAVAGRHAASPSGMASTQALQQAPHTATQAERLQVRVDAGLVLPMRSTVMLDERFAAAVAVAAQPGEGDEGTTAGPGSGLATPLSSLTATPPSGGTGSDLAGGPGGDAEADTAGGDSGHALADDSEQSAADSYADEQAQAEEKLDAFTSPSLRQASLRVGESEADAIDIRLSLSGQELDLGFRTDDAEARAALMRHAQGNLSDLLQRSGLQLGEVSVGPQGGQPGGGDATGSGGRPSGAQRPAAGQTGAAAEPVPPAPQRPRSDGSRPLDLFV